MKGEVARIELDQTGQRDVFRGEPAFEVSGRIMADADGAGIAGLRVQIYAVPASGGAPVPVGLAVTSGADGHFKAPLRLPPTLELGNYTLAAVSKANGKWAAARSNTQ